MLNIYAFTVNVEPPGAPFVNTSGISLVDSVPIIDIMIIICSVGAISGSVILKNTHSGDAPSSFADSYTSSGTFASAAIKYSTFTPKLFQISAITITHIADIFVPNQSIAAVGEFASF